MQAGMLVESSLENYWISATCDVNYLSILPGGFVEEHEWRIVDELQCDWQSFPLSSRQIPSPRLPRIHQTQRPKDLVDLQWFHLKMEVNRNKSVDKYRKSWSTGNVVSAEMHE